MVGWHQQLDGHGFEQVSEVGDGQGSLACCSPWGCKELDMTEQLNWTLLGIWEWKKYISSFWCSKPAWHRVSHWLFSKLESKVKYNMDTKMIILTILNRTLTRWTWVWVSSGSWWWTRKPGVLQSMGSQGVRHDWTTELNWIETGHLRTEIVSEGCYQLHRQSWMWEFSRPKRYCMAVLIIVYIMTVSIYLCMMNFWPLSKFKQNPGDMYNYVP